MLVLGGVTASSSCTKLAEIYDPNTNTWQSLNMTEGRAKFTATLLPDGTVLIAGGGCDYWGPHSVTAEIYDPITNNFTRIANMTDAHYGHSATLLPDGSVFIVGGQALSQVMSSSTELYQSNGTWRVTGAPKTYRMDCTSTLLPDGRIILIGGQYPTALQTAEIVNVSEPNSQWVYTSTPKLKHEYHTAVLHNGLVVVAGGPHGSQVESYDYLQNTWTLTSALITTHCDHVMLLFGDNSLVLVAGTLNGSSATELNSVEVYALPPSFSPTRYPTAKPTREPTAVPTMFPTEAPTSAPTAPTLPTTEAPTQSPTKPTNAPSLQPTSPVASAAFLEPTALCLMSFLVAAYV
jgi:hypothetical protein